jgi:aminoglycoside 9-adenylyltransferase
MNDFPPEAIKAAEVIEELLGSALVGAYLFGSAVVGGLRPESDVDLLVIANRRLPAGVRRELVARLMKISGKVANRESARPIELTLVNQADMIPWRYPPRRELLYGEWLREEFENNRIPEPQADPDLAIILTNVRQSSMPLRGPAARQIVGAIPTEDLKRALKESLPLLLGYLEGDERNVLLTLARMWLTAATGQIAPKDTAAAWAIERLPEPLRSTLDLARTGYRGEVKDSWADKGEEVALLADYLKQAIESYM